MPSRKKAQGKARAASKRATAVPKPAKENDLSQLFSKLSVCSGKGNRNICNHGCGRRKKSELCFRFAERLEIELVRVFSSLLKEGESDGAYSIVAGVLNTLEETDGFITLLGDNAVQRKRLVEILLCMGTTYILEDLPFVSVALATATLLAQHNFEFDQVMKSTESRNILRDMNNGGLESDVVKFFANRIPCQCLEQKLSEVKSEARLAICDCCGMKRERKQLFLCGRCLVFQYCSKSCQQKHYPTHKSNCVNWVMQNKGEQGGQGVEFDCPCKSTKPSGCC